MRGNYSPSFFDLRVFILFYRTSQHKKPLNVAVFRSVKYIRNDRTIVQQSFQLS